MAEELNPETLDQQALGLIYEVVRDQLDKQFEQIESLNNRAQQLVALGAGIFGLVVGLRPPTDNLYVTLLFLAPLLAFGALAFFGHRAWSIEQWRRDPEPGALWEKHGRSSGAKVRYKLIGQWIVCHEVNRLAIKKKLSRLRLTQLLLGILVACLVIVLLVLPYIQMAEDAPNPQPSNDPPSETPSSSGEDQTMRAAPISADPELEHRIELSRDDTQVVRIYHIEEPGGSADDE